MGQVIIKAHGGKVSFSCGKSELDGAVFKLFLPDDLNLPRPKGDNEMNHKTPFHMIAICDKLSHSI
ncbi:hypothetical protein [Xenorhabdus entomophaga]|uniref:hypothetical protein n=1 Tax=Xenorhabdus entomophaga TaxID=3136257 RepID=UPI0030F41DD6